MGGKNIRSESTVLMVPNQARAILEGINWLQYLNNLQGFNEEMTLEFLQNLQNGSTTIRGRNITIFEAVIAKVTRLPAEGTSWIDKHVFLYNAVTVFPDPSERLVRTGKAIHPSALRQPWKELAVIVQRYITCDG